mgnify:CR=1 FL=1
MRPTRKLNTRYDRREKYSNMVFMEPKAFIPLLALSGVVLYYTGKGISKVSGRKGKAATNTTRNVLVGLAAIVVYLKIKDNRFVKNNESNEETSTFIRPDLDIPYEDVLDANDPKTPQVNVLNV